jgi:cytochrome P450
MPMMHSASSSLDLAWLLQVTKDLLGRRDLFTRFLLLNEEAEEGAEMFTDKNLRDTMLNFVIAGRDTTAVTLSWFVYMMIQHPEVAEKIEQELMCTFEKSEKEDKSESAAPVIMNSKKSGLDDDDSKASDEASFSLRVAEYSQLLTYDSLLNLQYLYAAILETLRLYPAVPMVRTHTQKLNPSQMICPPVLPCNLSLQKTSMCFLINV